MTDYKLGTAKRRAKLGSAKNKLRAYKNDKKAPSAIIQPFRRTLDVSTPIPGGTEGAEKQVKELLTKVVQLYTLAYKPEIQAKEYPPPKLNEGDILFVDSVNGKKMTVKKMNIKDIQEMLKLAAS